MQEDVHIFENEVPHTMNESPDAVTPQGKWLASSVHPANSEAVTKDSISFMKTLQYKSNIYVTMEKSTYWSVE
ncbi:hypothetical protein ACFSUO_04420 [Lentibacillus juripiscarius]|uniref:Uncharacterized protein n=1 Tax=Lentibacillus juripiscarius TaxID=257446 RepID=A0ABW5V3F1_9BACI